MRFNQNTKIIGKRVILVPYEVKHVEKYHGWMQNVELQELTASEPLSLDDEFKMQLSWREDEDKCTFLILDRAHFNETNDEVEALVGDTNLFVRNDIEEPNSQRQLVAEAEIMIAEPSARGKGYGWEAMLLMLKYATEYLKITQFEAKIRMKNTISSRMFEKMQFKEISRSEVFKEITYQRPVNEEWLQWLDDQVQLEMDEYNSLIKTN